MSEFSKGDNNTASDARRFGTSMTDIEKIKMLDSMVNRLHIEPSRVIDRIVEQDMEGVEALPQLDAEIQRAQSNQNHRNRQIEAGHQEIDPLVSPYFARELKAQFDRGDDIRVSMQKMYDIVDGKPVLGREIYSLGEREMGATSVQIHFSEHEVLKSGYDTAFDAPKGSSLTLQFPAKQSGQKNNLYLSFDTGMKSSQSIVALDENLPGGMSPQQFEAIRSCLQIAGEIIESPADSDFLIVTKSLDQKDMTMLTHPQLDVEASAAGSEDFDDMDFMRPFLGEDDGEGNSK